MAPLLYGGSMNIESILTPERTVAKLAAGSKKRAFELASQQIVGSLPYLKVRQVYRGLLQREKLGSTGLGDGVAIPHCRLDSCKAVTGALFTLKQAIDFGAPDNLPVEVIFILLVPSGADAGGSNQKHLSTLAMLAERFANPAYRQALLAAESNRSLYQAAIQPLDVP